MKRISIIVILIFAFTICKAQMQPPSKEEHMKRQRDMLQKELQMSTEQQQKVDLAFKEFMARAEKLQAENPPPPPPPMDPKVKAAMDNLVQQRNAQIKQALTEEQFRKFLELEKKMRPPHPPMNKDQQPS